MGKSKDGSYELKVKPPKPSVKVVKVEKCLNCGKRDIKTWDCGYSSFNVCGVECFYCKRSFKINGDVSEEDLVKHWNKRNGRLTQQQKIEILREQIKNFNKDPEV